MGPNWQEQCQFRATHSCGDHQDRPRESVRASWRWCREISEGFLEVVLSICPGPGRARVHLRTEAMPSLPHIFPQAHDPEVMQRTQGRVSQQQQVIPRPLKGSS